MNSFKSSDLHIGIISDIILVPYFNSLLKVHFNKNVKIHFIPYGEHNDEKYQEQLKELGMVVVWLNIESSYLNACDALYTQYLPNRQIVEKIIASCEKLYTDISAYINPYFVWISFEDYFSKLPTVIGHQYHGLVDRINTELFEVLKDEVSFIDLKHLIAKVGIDNAYDPKGKYRWNAPYAKALIEGTVKEIQKQYLIERGITKKCLVLDCDNVLWGGVLSEDGIENLKLGSCGFGRAYQDFQRFVLALYYHGVILAVCSKNDLSDVLTVFHEHNEMLLKQEHIACFQVNWENKPDNIKRIAETLNISLDSIVFVDDSFVEIKAVKSMLPEVTAILYERDLVYNGLSCFNLKNNISIKNIERRNRVYQTNPYRNKLKLQYRNYDEYIDALEIKTDIHEALPIEYSRIAELTQRANKCTNGKRYTVAEIKSRVICENIKLYTISVIDCFSDLGLVGVFEIKDDILTLFCLSCRALGHRIEHKMLEFAVHKHQFQKIVFESTGKNDEIKFIFAQEVHNLAFVSSENN